MSDRTHGDLAHWRVADAMSAPIRACAQDVDVVAAARLMVAARIHFLAVLEADPAPGEEPAVVGVLSDLDLVAALEAGGGERAVGDVAGPPAASIPSDATLDVAARDMREAQVRHLVVVAPASGRPVGVISTLDIAQAAVVEPTG